MHQLYTDSKLVSTIAEYLGRNLIKNLQWRFQAQIRTRRVSRRKRDAVIKSVEDGKMHPTLATHNFPRIHFNNGLLDLIKAVILGKYEI